MVKLIKNDIKSLPEKSVDVQENAMLLDDILKTELYWQNFDESFVELLDTKVRPLMKRHQTTFLCGCDHEVENKLLQLNMKLRNLINNCKKKIMLIQKLKTKKLNF